MEDPEGAVEAPTPVPEEAPAAGAREEEEDRRRDWGGVPAEVVAKVAEKLVATEARGLALMANTCTGWKDALKQAGVWRDWGDRFGEGVPVDVLAKVANKLVALNDADWAAKLKEEPFKTEEKIQEEMEERKRDGNSRSLLAFAMVCKPWRNVQLKVGGPLRSRVESDVLLPGRVELAKWALAEGCPRKCPNRYQNMAEVAAEFGHMELVKWLIQEQGFAMDWSVLASAAGGGNLELVQWLQVSPSEMQTSPCTQAARSGHLEVLQWLRATGWWWDMRA